MCGKKPSEADKSETAEGDGKSSQFAEVKAIWTSLRDCWMRKVTCLSLHPDAYGGGCKMEDQLAMQG